MKKFLFCFHLFLTLTMISCAPKQYAEVGRNEVFEKEASVPGDQSVHEIHRGDFPEIKASILEKETPDETRPENLETGEDDAPEADATETEDETQTSQHPTDADVPVTDEEVSEKTSQASELTGETDTADTETLSQKNDQDSQEDESGESSEASETSMSEEAAAAEIDSDSYKIGSGDVLEITTWKEADFSKTLSVRIDGKITFPLLDDIKAGGLTTLQLKKQIEDGLKDYIEAPVVTVTVKGSQSQKFYILGEVSKTGEYNLVKNLTILQAFALAGGFTEWASKKEIILIRHENGKEKVMRINYKNIARGRDFSQNIQIQANDTIIVP